MDSGSRVGNGRYVVRSILGEGAQGITYDAMDVRQERPVAIKRYDVRGASSWKDVELAERETRVLATLDHPLVPRYIEHFEEDGALYLVMEKIEGETLDAIRHRSGPLPEEEVRRFLACADRMLTYLHGRASPVVHRDVKPRNVVRRADGSYVFVDFGAVSELLSRRRSSTVVGTIGYMAPEQLQGRALPATDVYGVGATALAALTGVEPETLPHKGLRIDVRAALQGRATPAMISSLEHMLEPDPDLRVTSLGAALDGARSPTSSLPDRDAGARRALPDLRERVPRESRGLPRHDDLAKENARVKSIRSLLWLLWGLGWIIVPLLVRQLDVPKSLIPMVMFSSLASLFVVTWHKGAIIRAVLRALMGKEEEAEATPSATDSTKRHRIEIGRDQQVRVHTTELGPEEIIGQTAIGNVDSARRQLARRL